MHKHRRIVPVPMFTPLRSLDIRASAVHVWLVAFSYSGFKKTPVATPNLLVLVSQKARSEFIIY